MSDRPTASWPGIAAALIAVGVAVWHVLLTLQEGDEMTQGTVISVTLAILGAGALAGVGATRDPVASRFGYLAGAALALTILGLMAIYYVGVPLLVAAALAGIAAFEVRPRGEQEEP